MYTRLIAANDGVGGEVLDLDAEAARAAVEVERAGLEHRGPGPRVEVEEVDEVAQDDAEVAAEEGEALDIGGGRDARRQELVLAEEVRERLARPVPARMALIRSIPRLATAKSGACRPRPRRAAASRRGRPSRRRSGNPCPRRGAGRRRRSCNRASAAAHAGFTPSRRGSGLFASMRASGNAASTG